MTPVNFIPVFATAPASLEEEVHHAAIPIFGDTAESAETRRDFLGEILELLLNGGYFRARLPSIAAFDKIIGGLAWSITASNVDVDFDLHYRDTLYPQLLL